MTEEWRSVPGLDPAYQVSNLGRARVKDRLSSYRRWPSERLRLVKGRMLKTNTSRYPHVTFDGKTRAIHRLVLLAFKGPPPFEGAECRHLNGVKHNNRLENLEWGTATENQFDRFSHGTACEGETNYRARLTCEEVRSIVGMRGKLTPTEIGHVIGCDTHLVKHVVYGQAWNWLTGLPRARYKPAKAGSRNLKQ